MGRETLWPELPGWVARGGTQPLTQGRILRLVASRHCLTAQRASLALVLCGHPLRAEAGPRTELHLSSPSARRDLALRDAPAILAALDGLYPGALLSADPELRGRHLAVIAHLAGADTHLAEAIEARNHRDLDIAIHLLREMLLRVERDLASRGAAPRPDARDAMIAPLIWRMMQLDRRHRSYLCFGMDRLVGLARRMQTLAGPRVLPDDPTSDAFLDRLSPDAAICLPQDRQPDWALALGPAGRAHDPISRTTGKTPILTAKSTSQPAPSRDGQLDAVAEKLRLIRMTSQQRRYPGRATPNLPSRAVVIPLLSNVVSALYPRHYGPAGLDVQAVDLFVAQRLRTIRQHLAEQLELEWLLHPDAEQLDCRRRARAAAEAFIDGLPQIRDLHDTDIGAAFQGDPSAKSLDEIVLCFPGIAAILHHRIAHDLYRLGAPMLARIMAEHSHSQSGIDIHPGARIGPACFIDHGTGVVIGETAVIGARVRLYQAVTLGARRFPVGADGSLEKGLPRHPIIEDDVVIYAGATVLGRITVGRGSSVGGNVWLTRSLPSKPPPPWCAGSG
jgi:serine O-acetyltransferase